MMDIGSILLILAILILVLTYVTEPFRKRLKPVRKTSNHELSALLAERDRILTALAELDFDYQLQKIPEEIYPLQRNALLDKGTTVLKQLDTLLGNDSAAVDSLLDEKIANRRQPIEKENDPIEALIAAKKKAPQSGRSFCPSCGEKVQQADAFCTGCGKKLT